MLNRPRLSRLTRSCVAALLGASAWSTSPLAHAQTPAAIPGQKPPCVPASSYSIAYDCELFPLPSAPAAAAVVVAPAGAAVAVVPAGAAVAVVPAVVVPPAGAAVAVVPAPVPEGGDTATPAAPADAVAVVPVVTVPTTPAVSSDDGPSHAPAYVAFAVGAGGIGMTVAFGILALGNKSTLNGECTGGTCPSSSSSTVSSLKTNGDLADVGLGLAVAGVAVGAILFATEHKSSTTTGKRHIEPWIGLGAGGFKGTF
jgi:hypothetical protein